MLKKDWSDGCELNPDDRKTLLEIKRWANGVQKQNRRKVPNP